MAIERWAPRQWLGRFGSSEGRSPMMELSRLEQQMEQMMDRAVRTWLPQGLLGSTTPAVDVIDKPDEILIRADVPGMDRKDLDLEVQNHTLILRGERKEEREEKEQSYYACERWTGDFLRSIPLPAPVDIDKIDARFRSGVLEIHLPKKQEAKGKKVDIRPA